MRALLLILLLAQPVIAQFEGGLSMRQTTYTDAGPSVINVELLIKNTNAAASYEGKELRASGRFIFRGDKNVLWIVSDAEKTYMEVSTDQGKMPAKKAARAAMKKTGKTKTLIGYACDEYLTSWEGEEHHIWATGKLASLYEGMLQSLRGMGSDHENVPSWQQELMAMRLVPLLVETFEDGELASTQEVLAIEKKAVPASTFDPPAGYTKHNVNAQINEMYKRMGEKGGMMKDKDFPGMNPEMEKMIKEMQERGKKEAAETDSSGDDEPGRLLR